MSRFRVAGVIGLTVALIASFLFIGDHQASTRLAELENAATSMPESTLRELDRISPPRRFRKSYQMVRLQCLEALGQTDELAWLYTLDPSLFQQRKRASKLAARGLLQTARLSELEQLIEKQEDRANDPEWVLIEADLRLKQKKLPQAVELLLKHKFEGTAESLRLTRLALLARKEATSWRLLQEALQYDPRNSEAKYLRGRFLERQGLKRRANREYVEAAAIEPNNRIHRHRLVQFYLRQRNFELALAEWERRPKEISNSPGYKFFASVVRGGPEGLLSQSDFNTGSEANRWLEMLALLKKTNFAEAKACFRRLEKARQLDPLMVWALEQTFAYRQGVDWFGLEPSPTVDTRSHHRFFQDLEKPKSMDELLRSDHAFSALFLAGGWMEAALYLPYPKVVPESYPNWYAYALGQALKSNRGPDEALLFARANWQHSGCRVLEAEVLLGKNQGKEALTIFRELATHKTPEGYRSAWLASLLLIERREFDAARDVLTGNPALKNSVTGKELEARTHFLESNFGKARTAYRELSKTSLEANVLLARDAFSRGDSKAAKSLSLQALEMAPESHRLWSNLEIVHQAGPGQ